MKAQSQSHSGFRPSSTRKKGSLPGLSFLFLFFQGKREPPWQWQQWSVSLLNSWFGHYIVWDSAAFRRVRFRGSWSRSVSPIPIPRSRQDRAPHLELRARGKNRARDIFFWQTETEGEVRLLSAESRRPVTTTRTAATSARCHLVSCCLLPLTH